MKLVTAAQMQELDRRTIREAGIPSLTLMEHAGTAVVEAMASRYGDLARKRVSIVCGKGHNGGDGLVVARILSKKRAQVLVFLLHPVSDLAADSKTMYRRLLRSVNSRAVVVCATPEQLAAGLAKSDLVVDALLGTGLSSPVTGAYGTAIDLMNQTGRPVIAVDLPSGLQTDTGEVLGQAVRADLTVTFGLPKLGLYLNEGIDQAGEVRIAELPPEAVATWELIRKGGPYPYAKDGSVFGNREGLLPKQKHGYYREYTVRTPKVRTRGARRIVKGAAGELFYTDDHYNSFKRIRE